MSEEEEEDIELNKDDGIFENDPKNLKILKVMRTKSPFFGYKQGYDIIRAEILPRFREAMGSMDERGRFLFLHGDFNTGKSFLLKYAIKRIKNKYPNLWRGGHRPMIKINFNNKFNTAEQFYMFLLDELHYPVDKKSINLWKQTNVQNARLRNLLITTLATRLRTRVIVLDECQRLLKARNPNISDIFEAIKDLTNKEYWRKYSLHTQFILCGTNDAYLLLEEADWIQGRAFIIHLDKLPETEYPVFLKKIYNYYSKLGISKKWDLSYLDAETGKIRLNQKFSIFLYERSFGKAGLTVEIIKYGIRSALNDNRRYPVLSDYKLVASQERPLDLELAAIAPIIEIQIKGSDRLCAVPGCSRSEKPYARSEPLLKHYKREHKRYKLVNSEGEEIR